MADRFVLAELSIPVLGAPMEGGPSTPELAAAVTNCGGLGFLASGSLSTDGLADAIGAARKLTTGALGVNLFVPQRSVAQAEQLDAFAAALAPDSGRYGVPLGEPLHDLHEWRTKLEVVCDLRPEVVSFTFGAPSDSVCRQLADVGILTLGTVTTVLEALTALRFGVDVLVAQGPEAGWHRATYSALAVPSNTPLDDLVANLVVCLECPVVAAGGLAARADVRKALNTGAAAVQVGTALLLADEAGTNLVHQAALRDGTFTETAVTRAFTGRYARAIRNRFIEQHEADAVCGFPEVAAMTAPLQAAAASIGDPQGVALWAGAAFRKVHGGPAADIVRGLAG